MDRIKEKMNTLRIEADEATAKVQELQEKVKALEQENLQKEQEITSLTHKNNLLETEFEKLESGIKEAKAVAEEGSQHGTQNETLQRRLQLLELRQTDVKAGHFERKVQALEQDLDQWEAKFEEMAKKYAAVQKDLEDFQAEIGNI
ncbi:hypothetical protein BOTNAR_0376g00080 [Botryotinia narcissicola]|uniref:Tropomyosin n=1 Tax=Botryotinia narcissicola TaxID=278944 RepID=A0A4Z1HP62_9HELO|nr:hypothetical protein BOTNAR_0376g00080 [Botryotinia narcissicola]